jgi:hypothetical protein
MGAPRCDWAVTLLLSWLLAIDAQAMYQYPQAKVYMQQ